MNCPCGSGKKYEICCKNFIEGKELPQTAEQLMRSRYTAYTQCNVDYIMDTHLEETRHQVTRDTIEDWAKSSKWEGLEITRIEKGLVDDKRGIVEFKASYQLDDGLHTHNESSLFVKNHDQWFYKGWEPLNQTIINENKIGRNDLCPCGSGKKYKKCCLNK